MPRYLKTGISEDAKADADAKVRRAVEDILAALYVFAVIGTALLLLEAVTVFRAHGVRGARTLGSTLLRFVDTFASMTADLTLLLATLSILTGAFVLLRCESRRIAVEVTRSGGPWARTVETHTGWLFARRTRVFGDDA